MTVFASLMAALTAAGALIAIPIGPVPIVLQNFFIFLCGLLLGPRWGVASVFVYLLAGGIGLPVFAGGKGGIGVFLGPTGGYLFGYLPCVFLIGAISGKCGHRPAGDILALLVGITVIYACGVPWLKMVTGMPFEKAFMLGMLPFLVGDGIKLAAAIPIVRMLRPYMDQNITNARTTAH